jgi:hypothetical protein
VSGSGFQFSHTSVRAYLTCPKQAAFRYVDRRRTPMVHRMALGRVGHAVTELGPRRILAGLPLPTSEEIRDVATSFAEGIMPEVAWAKDEDEDRALLAVRGAAIGEAYLRDVVPLLSVAAVEEPFEANIEGVIVRGRIDLVETIGVRETKTKMRAGSAWGEPAERLQLGMYAVVRQPMTARPLEGAIDTLVMSETKARGREVRHLPIILDADELAAEADAARAAVRFIAAATERGDYPRNPTACSTWGEPCAFLAECMPGRASAVERAEALKAEAAAAAPAVEKTSSKAARARANAAVVI